MPDLDPLDFSLRGAFTTMEFDVDEEAAWYAILACGRARQRRRAAAGVTAVAGTAIAALLIAILIATPGHRVGVSVTTEPTTYTTFDTTTTQESRALDPVPVVAVDPDSATTTAADPCAEPSNTLDGAVWLEATITVDQPTVVAGHEVGGAVTVSNPHDEYVSVSLDRGWSVFRDDQVHYQEWVPADIPLSSYLNDCQYIVFPPHVSVTGRLLLRTDPREPPGPTHLYLAMQDHMVPGDEFGGPGGDVTVVAPTTTTVADTTTTAEGSQP
jgi:hypothetical protein